MNLRELMTDAVSNQLDADVVTAPDGSLTWSRAGRPFAALSADGRAAEFVLDPAVAAAAVRTPDTEMSGRGPDWVLFRPATLDDHGADRATAWFASAHRRVARR